MAALNVPVFSIAQTSVSLDLEKNVITVLAGTFLFYVTKVALLILQGRLGPISLKREVQFFQQILIAVAV